MEWIYLLAGLVLGGIIAMITIRLFSKLKILELEKKTLGNLKNKFKLEFKNLTNRIPRK